MNRRRPIEFCLIAGVVGCVGLVLLAIWQLPRAATAWLAAYLFWAGLPIGALFLSLVHGLTGGSWGLALRPALAGMIRCMPLLALFLVPVLLAEAQIYPWARGGDGLWLAPSFFAARGVVYVVLWNLIALGAERWRGVDGRLPAGFAWPGLIVLFGTTTLAAFDWIMTLEPRWTSTIYGLLITTGWVLSALAVAIALTLADEPGLDRKVTDGLARIMLALIVLWAYLAAVQLVVIWESDLTQEIPWYLRRGTGGWQGVAAVFVIAQFLVPFLVLLWQPLRRSRAAVLGAALLVAAGHLCETWWLTVPDFGRPFGWADPLAVVAIGGCILFVIGRGGGRNPAPARVGRHAGG